MMWTHLGSHYSVYCRKVLQVKSHLQFSLLGVLFSCANNSSLFSNLSFSDHFIMEIHNPWAYENMTFSVSPTKDLSTFNLINIRYLRSLIISSIKKQNEYNSEPLLTLKHLPRHFISLISLNLQNGPAILQAKRKIVNFPESVNKKWIRDSNMMPCPIPEFLFFHLYQRANKE